MFSLKKIDNKKIQLIIFLTCLFVLFLFVKGKMILLMSSTLKKNTFQLNLERKKNFLSETVDSIEKCRELLLCGRIYKTVWSAWQIVAQEFTNLRKK